MQGFVNYISSTIRNNFGKKIYRKIHLKMIYTYIVKKGATQIDITKINRCWHDKRHDKKNIALLRPTDERRVLKPRV